MFGENIKRIREGKGLGVNELSRLSGVNASYISALERGEKDNPTINTLQKLADVLEVPLDYLTGESVKSIIEDKLSELNMTMEELSEKSKVPMNFLNNLDNLIPENEADYRSLNVSLDCISNILNIQPNKLRAALARQEPPVYDGPVTSAVDDFGGENVIKENFAEYTVKIPEQFIDPIKARAFVNSFVIFGSDGFDSNKLDDNEILQFANELLEHMDTIKYKYKK